MRLAESKINDGILCEEEGVRDWQLNFLLQAAELAEPNKKTPSKLKSRLSREFI